MAEGPPSDRAASIADVARLAGVSTQTVSRVVTGAQQVRESTREVVEAAMDTLGYVPNGAARTLRVGRARTFGVVVHQISRTGEARTVEAIVEAARVAGYTVTLADVARPSAAEVNAAVTRLQQQVVDGLIVVRHESTTPVDLRIPPGLPYVVSDAVVVAGHASVGADQEAGTRRAIEHLLALGHGTVHHIAGPPSSNPARVRREAWQSALRDAARPVPAVETGDWSPASGREAARELLRRRRAGEPVTAIFAANDEMAAGLLGACHDVGLRVPADLSVVGFDNIPLAGYLAPGLTTVEQDFSRIGSLLVDSLVGQLTGGRSRGRSVAGPGASAGAIPALGEEVGPQPPPGAGGPTTQRRVVPARLVLRGSTAPPPPAAY